MTNADGEGGSDCKSHMAKALQFIGLALTGSPFIRHLKVLRVPPSTQVIPQRAPLCTRSTLSERSSGRSNPLILGNCS